MTYLDVPVHARRPVRALLSAFLLLMTASVAAAPERSASLIDCYDDTREMVMRTRADLCQGRPVSEAEAAVIRDRRRVYLKESVEATRNPIILGKRLVSVGGGFFINATGALLTNAHVVKDCGTLVVSRAGGEMSPAQLVASEPGIDLALIRAEAHPARSAVFATEGAPLPDEVAIVGYPNQGLPPLRPLLTPGTVVPSPLDTGRLRPITIQADVRPGNSGGPVLDGSGHVVGVVFAAIDTPAVFKNTGRLVRDIGVAIPNRLALNFLERNGVSPVTAGAKTGIAVNRTQLLDDASQFVARVECWR